MTSPDCRQPLVTTCDPTAASARTEARVTGVDRQHHAQSAAVVTREAEWPGWPGFVILILKYDCTLHILFEEFNRTSNSDMLACALECYDNFWPDSRKQPVETVHWRKNYSIYINYLNSNLIKSFVVQWREWWTIDLVGVGLILGGSVYFIIYNEYFGTCNLIVTLNTKIFPICWSCG